MKTRVALLAATLLVMVAGAQAQGSDLFLGYSYGFLEAGGSADTASANGFAINYSKNLGPYFGITTDYGLHNGNFNDILLAFTPFRGFNSQQFFVGPQINIRTKRWNVFVRALYGFVRESNDSFVLTDAECAAAGIDCSLLQGAIPQAGGFLLPSQSVTKFGMSYGTGVDIYLARWFGLRVIQADYMPVRSISPTDTWKQNTRLSSGLVFRF